ncbi:MAG: hypothetical protein QG635_1943 [Bacteroidota bacterium]|nr:hypothetical protein [Bacteroidota bacterium]
MIKGLVKSVFYLITFTLIFLYQSDAQIKGLSAFETDKQLQDVFQSKTGVDNLLKGESMPIGNIVESEYYHIGPGDIFSIQILSLLISQEPVIVSPENTIMLPRIGEVSLLGKTLAEAKEIILNRIREWNPNAIAYVSLYQARTVLITIKGNVTIPGTYSFPASYRVSTAIRFANQERISNQTSIQQVAALLNMQETQRQTESLFTESGLPSSPTYSFRNIAVLHKDGSSQTADLEKAAALSNPEFDPFLREGDEIFVPFEAGDYPLISISGSVQRPFVTAFKEDDKASMLLKLGYGLKYNADLDNIYLVQPDNKRYKLTIDKDMNLQGEDYNLLPGSVVIVGRTNDEPKVRQGIVSVSGKVASPGVYIIKTNETRLKDVIELAGGFTEDAYLPLAYIARRESGSESPVNPRRQLSERFQYSDLTLDDTTRFNIDMSYRRPYVSCDFVAAFKKNSELDNVVLKDGDVINIPSNPQTVYIFGQVNQPGYMKYESGKTLDWYVQKAGGFAKGAVKSRARIIRGRTKVWLEGGDDVFVMAGDEIYVPRSPDLPPGVEVQTWGVIAGIIGSTAALINVIVWVLRY